MRLDALVNNVAWHELGNPAAMPSGHQHADEVRGSLEY